MQPNYAQAVEGLLFVHKLLTEAGPGVLHEVHASMFEACDPNETLQLLDVCGLGLTWHTNETLLVRLDPAEGLACA